MPPGSRDLLQEILRSADFAAGSPGALANFAIVANDNHLAGACQLGGLLNDHFVGGLPRSRIQDLYSTPPGRMHVSTGAEAAIKHDDDPVIGKSGRACQCLHEGVARVLEARPLERL